MKKNLMYLLILPICLLGLVLLPTSAQALVFTIDKVLTGDGYTTGWDFGTVTLSDNDDVFFGPEFVDIDIALNDSSDYIGPGSHLKVVALNFSEIGPPTGAHFEIFAYYGILYDPDNVEMGGFKSYFDLRIPNDSIPGNENFATKPHDYFATIGLLDEYDKPIDIDPEDFAWETGGVYMAFHIGGLETDIIDGSDSVWAGANLPNSVPEPATMLLLGVGLIGLAGIGRKKFVKK